MTPRLLALCLLTAASLSAQVEPTGAELYRQYCAACHGQEGLGIPQAFPPLAASDFIAKQRERALRAPLEGLKDRIEVNGQAYQGWMAPVTLRDEDLTKVFNYVFSSWGNAYAPTSAAEIAAIRAQTTYPTYEKLLAAMSPDVLPPAPAGWKFSVAASLDFQPTRLTAHPDGQHVLILAAKGDIWSWDIATHEVALLWSGKELQDFKLGDPTCLGLGTDDKGRLYFISNQCNKSKMPVVNEVTIFRTEPWAGPSSWTKPKPWLVTAYNFGVGPYNHGVNHIAQGPDGLLYVSSGSRTDGGETGQSPNYDKSGENPLTAKLWRINPETESPQIEIFAHGLRNTYHFTWDHAGRLLGVENGTDADTPEELNLIEHGKHYGFPYEFGDWT
jgi:glucose/arabinose dehydrogenase